MLEPILAAWGTTSTIHAPIHTSGQFRLTNSPILQMHVCGLWEKARVLEKTHVGRESMQNQYRKATATRRQQCLTQDHRASPKFYVVLSK